MSAIESFSGTHPFRTECVAASVELDWMDQDTFTEEHLRTLGQRWAEKVDDSLAWSNCPRCGDHLDFQYAAGSRVTTCRCIPICPACGTDEAYQPLLGRPISRVWEWPIGKSARTRRKNKIEKNMVPAVIDVASNQVLSEHGVSQIRMRPNSGGWAEYGFDNQGDQ